MPDNELMLSGIFTGSVDFNWSTEVNNLSATNQSDVFVVRYGDGTQPTSVFHLETKQESGLLLFPNPTSDIIYISTAMSDDDIIITDISGRILHAVKTNNIMYRLDISDYSPGIYVVKKGAELRRFMKW